MICLFRFYFDQNRLHSHKEIIKVSKKLFSTCFKTLRGINSEVYLKAGLELVAQLS